MRYRPTRAIRILEPMRAVVLAMLCGCGFHVGAQARVDGAAADVGDDDASAPASDAPPTIDAAATPDGPLPTIDAPPLPTWTVIETLNVPVANGAQVTSVMSLALGMTYHLRVSGSYVTDNNANP